jgi:hypothetical protein
MGKLNVINREQLLSVHAFEQSFNDVRFNNEVETFLKYVNACVSKDVSEVIGDLLKCACTYQLHISMYKSIFLDLAWAVLENDRSLWTKEEKAMGFSDIDLHWSLYPEYDGSFDDYESIVLDQTSYFEEVMDLLTQEEFHYRAEVCFALYVLFVQRK